MRGLQSAQADGQPAGASRLIVDRQHYVTSFLYPDSILLFSLSSALQGHYCAFTQSGARNVEKSREAWVSDGSFKILFQGVA